MTRVAAHIQDVLLNPGPGSPAERPAGGREGAREGVLSVCLVPPPESLRDPIPAQLPVFSPGGAGSASADVGVQRGWKSQKVGGTFIPQPSARLLGVALERGRCSPGARPWRPPPFPSVSAAGGPDLAWGGGGRPRAALRW